MPNPSEQNRRRFPRANYTCQLTVWQLDRNGEVLLAETTNIGAGGLCIKLNKSLLLGTVLDIRIDFTEPPIPFKCRGRVVRSTHKDDLVFEIGVEFDGLDEVKQSFLQGKVSDLMMKEQNGN